MKFHLMPKPMALDMAELAFQRKVRQPQHDAVQRELHHWHACSMYMYLFIHAGYKATTGKYGHYVNHKGTIYKLMD